MTKTKVALIVAFVAIFAAGAVVGRVGLGTTTDARVSEPKVPTAPRHPSGGSGGGGGRERSFWVKELNLSPEQHEQMRKIWAETMSAAGRQFHERRQAVEKEFDTKLRALIGESNQPAYEALLAARQQQMDELGKGRGKAFEEAVARTKAILTPDQAKKYDEILAKRREFGGGSDRDGRRDRDRDRDGRRGGGPGFGASGPRNGSDRPSTRPSGG